MKQRSIILALLFVLGFSIFHEYTFALNDDNHCVAMEYVHEFSEGSSNGDECDVHFEYHQLFVLSPNVVIPNVEYTAFTNPLYKKPYNFQIKLNLLRPPNS